MSRSVIQNFRNSRALIVHPVDANREILATSLRRLGLLVALAEPGAEVVKCADACDFVFFDADQGLGGVFGTDAPEAAYLALIDSEAPGQLGRVVRQRCCAHFMKPVKVSGVFTAVNEFAARKSRVARAGGAHPASGRPPPRDQGYPKYHGQRQD